MRGVEVTSNLTDEVSDELRTGEVTTDEVSDEMTRGEVTGESVMWKPASISFIATLFLSLLF